MTNSRSSGDTVKPLASGVCNTEFATRPSLPSGVICRLVGGPSSEFISGNRARITGFAGVETSMTRTSSLPGGPLTEPSGP